VANILVKSMDKFVIQGNKSLTGEIKVAGAKNAALKLLAGSLLTNQECNFTNMPRIEEIDFMLELMRLVGAEADWSGDNSIRSQCQKITSSQLDEKMVRKFRSSIMVLSPLLLRTGRVDFYYPGGCIIGKRPIDMYLEGFTALGVKVKQDGDYFSLTADNLTGGEFVFHWISHTVTESLIMLATMISGRTKLVNTAQEPEVVQLCSFLREMGAKISGDGTAEIIIEGVQNLNSADCQVIPDRLETGTFAILGALLGAPINITHCQPSHLAVFWKVLSEMGIESKIGQNEIEMGKARDIKPTEIRTHEYPGLVTDLQPPLTLLATQAKGLSLIHETIYEGRLFYTDMLNRMGANIIMCDPHRVVVNGPRQLFGAQLESPDIRAGITLVLAALMASGKSTIEHVSQIDRGYENIEKRLQNLGAQIERINQT